MSIGELIQIDNLKCRLVGILQSSISKTCHGMKFESCLFLS